MREGVKPFKRVRLQWVGIGLGILYWFLESLLDSFLFHQGSITERIFAPDPNELWMRLLVIAIIIVFGLYAQTATAKSVALEVLKNSDKRYRDLVDNAIAGVYQSNLRGNILYVNEALSGMLGFESPKEMMSAGVLPRYKNPKDRDILIENIKEKGKIASFEIEVLTKTGKTKNVLISASLDGEILSGMVVDITERRQAAADLENSLSLLHATLESTADGILVVNKEGKITSFNKKFTAMWSIPELIIASKDDNQVITFVLEQLKDQDKFLTKVRELYAQPYAESDDVLEFKDGRVFERYSRPQLIGVKNVGRVWSFRDVTEQKRAEEKIKHMAYHDPLTDLPNRTLFYDRLNQAILYGHRENEPFALMFLDLDRFKEINDTHGHNCGDFLLKQLSHRLRGILRESDTVARIGGDEFAIILQRSEKIEGAVRAAEKIMEAMKPPFNLVKTQVNVTVSIGIAVFPEHGEDINILLQRADSAMYKAKHSGKGFVVYVSGEDQV